VCQLVQAFGKLDRDRAGMAICTDLMDREGSAMTVTLRPAVLRVPMLCLLVSFSAYAAQPQPGQWRVTTKTTIAGLPAGVPAGMGQQEHTQTQCVTPEQAKDPGKNWQRPDGRGSQNCTNKNSWNGGVLTIDATCAGDPPTTIKGTMTFDSATHYKGSMNSSSSAVGAPMQVTIAIEGQRTGDCP
jgi:hypothetical protein